MFLTEKLELVAQEWRKEKIPILTINKAKYLEAFVHKKEPKCILELGTAIGYSTTILAQFGANVTTIDRDKKILIRAQKLFEELELPITIISGDVIEQLQLLVKSKKTFDFIFIDCEKKTYVQAYAFCEKMIQKNGVIVFDNAQHPKCKEELSLLKKKHEESKIAELVTIDDGMLFLFF